MRELSLSEIGAVSGAKNIEACKADIANAGSVGFNIGGATGTLLGLAASKNPVVAVASGAVGGLVGKFIMGAHAAKRSPNCKDGTNYH